MFSNLYNFIERSNSNINFLLEKLKNKIRSQLKGILFFLFPYN